MKPLRVGAEGLRALAGRCDGLADSVSVSAPDSAASIGQDSAAAVAACDGRAAAAGAALAGWARTTAGSLRAAASGYENRDASAATDVAARGV